MYMIESHIFTAHFRFVQVQTLPQISAVLKLLAKSIHMQYWYHTVPKMYQPKKKKKLRWLINAIIVCLSFKIDQVLHDIVDDMCGRCKHVYQEHESTWTLEDWWNVRDAAHVVLKSAVSLTWTKDQIQEATSSLSEHSQQAFVDVIDSRRSDIRSYLLTQTYSISPGVLNDFDWNVKVGTLKISNMLWGYKRKVLSMLQRVIHVREGCKLCYRAYLYPM